METMLLPLKRYAQFGGRSSRQEFWLFAVLILSVFILLALFAGLTGQVTGAESGGTPWINGFYSVVMLLVMGVFLIPQLAVTVRRLHDQDRSAWFLLVLLVPLIGSLLLLVLMCLPGSQGPNRYGYPFDDANAAGV